MGAAQVTEMCLSGTCEASVFTKTVETGQVFDVAVPGHTEVVLETGTVDIKVIDAKEDVITLFVDTAPEAGVIWAMFLVVWRCLWHSKDNGLDDSVLTFQEVLRVLSNEAVPAVLF